MSRKGLVGWVCSESFGWAHALWPCRIVRNCCHQNRLRWGALVRTSGARGGGAHLRQALRAYGERSRTRTPELRPRPSRRDDRRKRTVAQLNRG